MPLHSNRAAWEASVKAGASSFSATLFLGRARYDTVRGLSSLEAARLAGAALVAKHKNGRPAMLYAHSSSGDSVHVENVTG